MRYRFEYKYLLSAYTADILRSRIYKIMKPDYHSNGKYVVNNLYLDDMYNNFYLAKHIGQFQRDKYRIRYYNNDMSFIRIERKHKDGIVSYKETSRISEAQYLMIKAGNFNFLDSEDEPLWNKLALLNRLRRMQPTAEYAYRREAWIYEPGNIRFTFDSPPFNAEKSRIYSYDTTVCSYGSEEYSPLMLEVKYTGFMPEIIKQTLNGLPVAHVGISKYCVVRERGHLSYGQI